MRSLTACPSSAARFSPANAIHEAQIAADASSSVDMARARKPSGRRSAGQIGIVGRPACFPPQPRIDRGGRPRFSSCAARIDRPRIPGRYLAPIPVLRAAQSRPLAYRPREPRSFSRRHGAVGTGATVRRPVFMASPPTDDQQLRIPQDAQNLSRRCPLRSVPVRGHRVVCGFSWRGDVSRDDEERKRRVSNPAPRYLRNPDRRLEPLPRRVLFGGERVADSTNMMLMLESRHLPVYYFPIADVRADLLRPTDRAARCPYKGEASYDHRSGRQAGARRGLGLSVAIR